MRYFKFEYTVTFSTKEKSSIFERIFDNVLDFITNALGDFYKEEKFNLVRTWYIEFEEETGSTCREIGVDADGNVQVKAEGVCGFWIDADLTLDDYRKFGITPIDFKTFQQLWFSSIIQGNTKEQPREQTEQKYEEFKK